MLRIDHIALLFAVGIQFLFISASKYLLLKIKSGKYVAIKFFYKKCHLTRSLIHYQVQCLEYVNKNLPKLSFLDIPHWQ